MCLCAAFGGETGRVVRTLAEDGLTTVRAVDASGTNGAYVHDRRRGERVSVAEMPPDLTDLGVTGAGRRSDC